MSQWGLWADELDSVELTMLTAAYIRRKRFEGQASLAAWGEASRAGRDGERITPDAMLMRMGVGG